MSVKARHQAFANRLRMYLQAMSLDRHEYGQRNGKLVNPHLHKVVLNKPGYSDRVFKKVTRNKTLDVAVSIVCDLSGSMSGPKWDITREAMHLLNGSIGNVLRIPLEISTFATYHNREVGGEHNLVCILRHFAQLRHSDDDMEYAIQRAEDVGFNNNQDGEAVAAAYHRLLQRKEPRRIMIVLSDGQPWCARIGNYRGYLKDVTDLIQKSGKVEVYGFGILSDSVKGYYDKHVVCEEVERIDIELLNLLKQAIVK